jgi:hypothetical protein
VSFKLSLDDVEPWTPGGMILGPGAHPIRVVEEEVDESGDHPVVKVQMVATGGEEKGGEIRDWIHVTEKTLGRIAQIYKAFGIEVPAGEFEWIPIDDKEAKIIVVKEPRRDGEKDDQGNVKLVSEVKAYAPLSDADKAVQGTKDAFAATEVKGKDDDIPF